MTIGVVGRYHGTVPAISKIYKNTSNFTSVKCDGLERLCNIEPLYDISNDIIDISYPGLTLSEISTVNDCANELLTNHQEELSCRAVDKVNYEDSQLFKSDLLAGETVESISLLRDKFYIAEIKLCTTKKILDYYILDVRMKTDSITFNGAKYGMKLKVMIKDKPFDFKISNVNFIIDSKKEGEK